MVDPIKPKDAKELRILAIPDQVIAAFNHMITENLRHGYASFTEAAVVKEICWRMSDPLCAPYTKNQVYEHGWLSDIPALFRKSGWKVIRDVPGYNESGETRWEFSEEK